MLGPLRLGSLSLLRLATLGLSALSAMVLVKVMGTTEYGRYVYLLSWVSLAATAASMGLDRLLVKTLAAALATQQWGEAKGSLIWSARVAVGATLVVAGLLGAAWSWLGGAGAGAWVGALIILAVSVVGQWQQAALRGLHRVAASMLGNGILEPMLRLVLVVGCYGLGRQALTAGQMLRVTGLAGLAGGVLGGWLLVRAIPGPVQASAACYRSRVWWRSALWFLLIGGFDAARSHSDLVLLGSLGQGLGTYAVLQQVTRLLPLGMALVTMAVLPDFARLHAMGDRPGLQRLVSASTGAGLALAMGALLGLGLVGPWLFGYLGIRLSGAWPTLAILCVGQVVNAGFGPVAGLLLMTGHERDVVVGLGLAALVGLGAGLALIPVWGMTGAALASSAGLVVWNGLLGWWVQQRLGILPTPLGSWLVTR